MSAGLVTLVGLLADAIPLEVRIPLIIACAIAWTSARRIRKQEDVSDTQQAAVVMQEQQRLIETFEASLDQLEMERALDFLAQSIVPIGAWRMSVYVYDVESKLWKRIYRRADNPAFQSSGRSTLKPEETFLHRPMRYGLKNTEPAIEITGVLADFETDPDGWIQDQEEWGLPPHVAQKVQYKARRYAFAEARIEGRHDQVIALVMEVLDPERLEPTRFSGLVTRHTLTLIAQILHAKTIVTQASEVVEAAQKVALQLK